MHKLPWDIPTTDRKLYEPICAKPPEDRTPMEALAKKYIDLCAQAVDERDVNIDRAQKAERMADDLRSALGLVIDNVDYVANNCRVNEMVGAVLPREIIAIAHKAIGAA